MKQYPNRVIQQAKELRSQGYTYPEIRKQLAEPIPKGTLSGWFKNIIPPPKYFERLQSLTSNNIWKAQATNKQRLEERLQNLRNKNQYLVQYINKDIGKIILGTLYWCEGLSIQVEAPYSLAIPIQI